MSMYMEYAVFMQILEKAGFRQVSLLSGARIRTQELLSRALPSGMHAVVAALPYGTGPPDDFSSAEDPHGLIEAFARRHYYREAADLLKSACKSLETGVPAGSHRLQFRIFSNSGLPEKEMAVLAGMGFVGRNNLVINPKLGSRYIIAGCLIPEPLLTMTVRPAAELRGVEENAGEQALCATCSICAAACPSRALSDGNFPGSTFEKYRCLQYYAARLEILPEFIMEAWGKRLYGCGVCQEVCPYNKNLSQEIAGDRFTGKGAIGPSLSLTSILSMGESELKLLLKGAAFGMSWVPPLAVKRNALVAAAHTGKNALPALLYNLIKEYASHQIKAVREAANWTLKKLQGQ